jgi:hypothetical protein
MNKWIAFLKKHSGLGYTRQELSDMYQKKAKSRSPVSTKQKCRDVLSKKIGINMREYKSKSSPIKSPKQAIAVSYSQVKKKYPSCKRFFKK